MSDHSVYCEPASEFLGTLGDDCASLLWTDPPFGTGDKQKLLSSGLSYEDFSAIELLETLYQLIPDIKRVMKKDGLVAILLDYRSIHEVVRMFKLNGFTHISDIIWHFETGGLSKKWWSNKHNVIALFSTTDELPYFDFDAVPMVDRKAPKNGYTGAKKVNSVWNINMSTTDPQRTGYPTQKPLELAERFIQVHTRPGDLVLDPFAGSGTLAEAALTLGRDSMSADISPVACDIIKARLDA